MGKHLRDGKMWALVALTAIMLVACEEDLDLTYGDFPPKINVYASINPEEPVKVVVSSTNLPTDPEPFEVPEGVEAVLTFNGEMILLSNSGDGVFRPEDEIVPQPGDQLTVRVTAPGFDPVSASTTVPFSSSIENGNIQFLSCETTPDPVFCSTEVDYELFARITHGENRYYHMLFYQVVTTLGPDPETNVFRKNPINSLGPGLVRHAGSDNGILIDSREHGVSKSLQFTFTEFFLICESGQNSEEPGPFFVELRTVTESYYLYHSSLSRQLQSRQDPFAEPIQVFSNIDGGVGVFSAFDTRFFSSTFPCL